MLKFSDQSICHCRLLETRTGVVIGTFLRICSAWPSLHSNKVSEKKRNKAEPKYTLFSINQEHTVGLPVSVRWDHLPVYAKALIIQAV